MNVAPAHRWSRQLMAASRLSEQRRCAFEDAAAEQVELSRRQFLHGAAALGAGLVTIRGLSRVGPPVGPPAVPRNQSRGRQPRVVVVGAGLAGLRCAEILSTRFGVTAAVYEASDRVGGRCWTLRNYFTDGQVSEHGGGFISTEHTEMRRLAADFGLRLEVVSGGNEPGLPDTFWLNGELATHRQINAAWQESFPAIRRAVREAGSLQDYRHHTAAGIRLDHSTVPDWVERHVAGGASGPLGQLLLEDVIAEFGGDPDDQSMLNLLGLISSNGRRGLADLVGTDEKYHVVGGNDLVVNGLLSRLPADSVHTGHALVAVRDNGDGSTTCVFESGVATREVVADRVVLALPFSTLRRADLSRAGFSDLKLRAIRQMGMGTNAKLHVQLASRPWMAGGRSGVCYTGPESFQLVWDETVAQRGTPGILLQYPGGTQGASMTGAAHGPAPAAEVVAVLDAVEPVFPGTVHAYRGLSYRDAWVLDPWHLGAYSYWRTGQTTSFAGYEGVPEGGVHFCGEHTSFNFQGYMEGAVRSGQRVADEVAGALRLAEPGHVAQRT